MYEWGKHPFENADVFITSSRIWSWEHKEEDAEEDADRVSVPYKQ